MVFLEKKLILDNFRRVLKDYSVDIQDVVRSAILDDLDISEYIVQCKDDPYRLDQIRLAMKEGTDQFFYNLNGNILFQIRKMNTRGVDLREIKKQLEGGLSDEHIEYLLKWTNEGVRLTGLNLAIIPKSLLSVFDMGLHSDVDMSVYNNGNNYSADYVRACIRIQMSGRSVEPFLLGDWDVRVVDLLSKHANNHSSNWWDKLMSSIDHTIEASRIFSLISLSRTTIPIETVQVKVNGKYKYDDRCLDVLLNAYSNNVDYKELLTETDVEKMKVKYSELKLKKKRKISGTLVRYPSENK